MKNKQQKNNEETDINDQTCAKNAMFTLTNGPYSRNGLIIINAHPLPGGKMAEFASDDTGAYCIASFYKYAVAKYNLYIYWFLKLCTAYSIVCRFDLDFSTTFLPCLCRCRCTVAV